MAFIQGREATFSYSSGPETGATIVTTKFNMVVYEISRRIWPTTPPGYLMQRYTPGILNVIGRIGMWYDSGDATFPVPGGVAAPSSTVGTIVITTVSGHTYTFKATLTKLAGHISTDDGGPPQTFMYDFISNAQSASDSITVA